MFNDSHENKVIYDFIYNKLYSPNRGPTNTAFPESLLVISYCI